MGGKSKQSQRTKNNVRPSSSARSAGILSNSSFTSPSGDQPLSPFPLFHSLAAAVNLEQGLNSDFLLCVKKLNKKDPITKTKALQELCELVKNNKIEDVLAVLPSWGHYYKNLASDPDNKVREYTQKAHGVIVSTCGKRISPQLRQLVPGWLHAQHDDYGPAASAAQASLNSTFPPNKLPELLSFCKTEVITYLIDNLIGNAEANIAKRLDSPEEREIYCTRLVSSSLHGLQYFVLHLARDNDAWLWEQLDQLLASGNFWKLMTNKNQLVRAAWYGCVSRIIERFPQQFSERYGRRCLRGAVAVKEEGVSAAQLWGCLLMYMHSVEDWYTLLDQKELLIKRVVDILENGGWGDAKLLSSMILPLLSKLPDDMLNKKLFETIFNAMFVGLEKKSVMSSKSERNHWLTSLSECLRYLSIQNYDYVVEVTTSVHRKWLEESLSLNQDGTTRDLLIKYAINNMAALVKYWIKQSNEESSEKYDQLSRNFWQNIASTILAQIDNCPVDISVIEKSIEGHILVLETFKTAAVQPKSQSRTITFEGDSTTADANATGSKPIDDANIIDRYKHSLNDVVVRVCSRYLMFASEKQISSPILVPLTDLLMKFDSQELFLSLGRQFEVDSVYGLFDKVMRPWLAGDTMRCKVLVDITFFIIKYLSDEQLELMLHSFNTFPPSVIEWCMSLSHSHPYASSPHIIRWQHSDAVRECVVVLCKRVVQQADCRALDLLLTSLQRPHQEGVVVNNRALDSMLSIITTALADYKAHTDNLEAVCKVCAALCDAGASGARPALPGVLKQMFHLLLDLEPYNPYLSLHTWRELRAEWQLAVHALPPPARETFLRTTADEIHRRIQHGGEDLNLKNMEHIVSICPYLIGDFGEESSLPNSIDEIIEVTKYLFDLEVTSESIIERCALRHECVLGKLNCPLSDNEAIGHVIKESDKRITEFTKADILSYMNKVMFRALFMRTIFLHNVSTEAEEETVEVWGNQLLKSQYFQQEFNKFLYDYVIVCSLSECYGIYEHFSIIEKTKPRLDTILEEILKETPHVHNEILSKLSELAASKGYFWAVARRECEFQMNRGKEDNIEVKEGTLDITKLEEIVTGSGFFHVMQANLKHTSDNTQIGRALFATMVRSFYLAHAHEPEVVDQQFGKDALTCEPTNNVDVIVNAYYRHNHTMLYEREIETADWRQVVSNAAIVDYLTHLVETRGWELPAHQWDFTTITLCSIVNSIHKSKKHWGTTKVALLTRSTLQLYCAVHAFVKAVPERCMKQTPLAHVAHLPAEWKDIFAPDITTNLFSIVLSVLESSATPVTTNHATFLSAVIAATQHLDWDQLPNVHKLGEYHLSKVVAKAVAVLVRVTHHAYKYTAYRLLRAIEKPLVLEDAEKLAAWSCEEGQEPGQKPSFCLEYFVDTLDELQILVDAALSGVQVLEQPCELPAGGTPHSLALGYLLLLDAVFCLCTLPRGDLTQHYIIFFRELKFGELIMCVCARLLPGELLEDTPDPSGAIFTRLQHFFCDPPSGDVFECSRSEHVNALACRVLLATLGGVTQDGARIWAGTLPSPAYRRLQKIVQSHVTPVLLRREYELLRRKASDLKDTDIEIHPSCHEVVVTFLVDDVPVALTVTMSGYHPLVPPRLACDHPAAPNLQWIALYLAYQNGTVLNAVRMFTAAVSKRVAAAAACCVCYCKLHPHSGHPARVHCRQCHNFYHFDCLRKWFGTSTKSECPLCRTAF